jgi:hypothetical protein
VGSPALAGHAEHGDAGLEPRSRRPRTSPHATSEAIRARILALRIELHAQGLDAGAETIAAAQPNETWQSDFTHWHLADGTDVEILDFLDNHSRYLLHAHPSITGQTVVHIAWSNQGLFARLQGLRRLAR